jgi:hypothetical protein
LMTHRGLCVCVSVACLGWLSPLSAQQLLDRVVARVGTAVITSTDVDAAIGLGLVEARDRDRALEQLVQRRLILDEVARFPPQEPSAEDVAAQMEKYRSAVGSRLPALMNAVGFDDDDLRDIARDALRIQNYLNQRFGTTAQVSDAEVREYYRAHPQEFLRNGTPQPFDEVATLARERAAAERRQAGITRWLGDLRARADIIILPR